MWYSSCGVVCGRTVSCLIKQLIRSSYSVPATNSVESLNLLHFIFRRTQSRTQEAYSSFERWKAEVRAICSKMSHLDRPHELCPPQDVGGDAANYQYPPPPGEDNEQTRAYHYPAASNSSFVPPSISYNRQFLQPGGYPQESRVNPHDSYTNAQQSLSDYGRDHHSSSHGFQHMPSTRSAPKQRAAVACRYCRRRKVSRYSFLTVIYISTFDF
jgi:hypothetical protein